MGAWENYLNNSFLPFFFFKSKSVSNRAPRVGGGLEVVIECAKTVIETV